MYKPAANFCSTAAPFFYHFLTHKDGKLCSQVQDIHRTHRINLVYHTHPMVIFWEQKNKNLEVDRPEINQWFHRTEIMLANRIIRATETSYGIFIHFICFVCGFLLILKFNFFFLGWIGRSDRRSRKN